MNRLIRRFGALLLVATLATACSTPAAQPAAPQPAPAPTVPAPEPSNDATTPAFDFAHMTDDVYIQYNAEPRIHSPMRTLVPPLGQTYSVYFREPMDRASVELALQEQDKRQMQPRFAFQWKDDRQLLVTADVEIDKVPYGYNTYRLKADGAKTKSGRTLENAPSLIAAVESPHQLWRVSLDGEHREAMTRFEQPYRFDFLDDGRTLFLTRPMEYCQCDAVYPKLYSLFDTQTQSLTAYPVELQRSYKGEGAFMADKRGFFYTKPVGDVKVPQSDSAVQIKVDGYVHGASFTRDRAHVLMIVGDTAETNGKFRLVIHHLASGTQDRLEKEIVADAPTSAVSDARIPVVFHDDGEYAYFLMQKPEGGPIYYQLNLKTMQTSSWTTTDHPDAWYGFKETSDGVYRLYANAGLYQGENKVSGEMNLYNGEWIKGTHLLALRDIDSQADSNSNLRGQLKLFDADQQKSQLIASRLPVMTEVLGSSHDGRWIYVSAPGDLNKK